MLGKCLEWSERRFVKKSTSWRLCEFDSESENLIFNLSGLSRVNLLIHMFRVQVHELAGNHILNNMGKVLQSSVMIFTLQVKNTKTACLLISGIKTTQKELEKVCLCCNSCPSNIWFSFDPLGKKSICLIGTSQCSKRWRNTKRDMKRCKMICGGSKVRFCISTLSSKTVMLVPNKAYQTSWWPFKHEDLITSLWQRHLVNKGLKCDIIKAAYLNSFFSWLETTC